MFYRRFLDALLRTLCFIATAMAIFALFILIYHITKQALPWLKLNFLINFPSRIPSKAGIKAALVGSLYLIVVAASLAIPLGVLTAVYLSEYCVRKNWLSYILQINISSLAGLPSIVYGLLGLAIFVRFFGFDRSILSAGLTLGLLILPMVVLTAQESLKMIPQELRLSAFALGAQKWHVVFYQVLPAALPGIMTGVILSISRAIGETAPLIIVGAVTYTTFLPEGFMDMFSALPIQIYNWASRPQESFHGLAAAGILILLITLFLLNSMAIYVRQKFQKYQG